jgi:hypothetical protein
VIRSIEERTNVRDKYKETRTVVAAQPGFDVVELCDNSSRFDYNPIVAWIVNVLEDDGDVSSSYTNPVYVDQVFYGMTSQIIIRQPDGSIVFPCSAKLPPGLLIPGRASCRFICRSLPNR